MSNLIEIRWHGRGGQGAKTASLLLADAAFNTGKYIQGFPEYGPERMGAPITAFNRISDEPITVHSNIYYPDYVVVVDDTLLDAVDVTSGLKESGAIVINSTKDNETLKSKLNGYNGGIYKLDAKSISIAAASIIAKVTRDRILDELDVKYPMYGYKNHKGYPTKAHLEAIEKYGINEEYRKSYKPVQKIIEKQGNF